MPALLLWDIDGTILRSGGAGMRAMAKVADRLFGPGFSWEGIDPGGNLDPLIFSQAARNNRLDDHDRHHATFHDQYIMQLADELTLAGAHVEAMPGVVHTIRKLHDRATQQRDIIQGLLTGNYAKAAPLKLRAVGVDPAWFSITAFGEDAPTRPDLVALAMKKYERVTGKPPHPRRVIVIGDTPHDVRCALAHGCFSLAVATGWTSADDLRAAGADLVLDDLADPSPLLRLIDRD